MGTSETQDVTACVESVVRIGKIGLSGPKETPQTD